jgi:hypothetical protein
MLSLPALNLTADLAPEHPFSDAFDIDDAVDVVGKAQFNLVGPFHAFLKPQGGPMLDLNTLTDDPTSWELTTAVGISKDGEYIVGNGQHDGQRRGFLLSKLTPSFHQTQYEYGNLGLIPSDGPRVIGPLGGGGNPGPDPLAVPFRVLQNARAVTGKARSDLLKIAQNLFSDGLKSIKNQEKGRK